MGLMTERNATLAEEKRALARGRAEAQAEADAARELALAKMAMLQRRAQDARRIVQQMADRRQIDPPVAATLERLQDESGSLQTQVEALEERLRAASRELNAAKATKFVGDKLSLLFVLLEPLSLCRCGWAGVCR